jgi:hypothetical protein
LHLYFTPLRSAPGYRRVEELLSDHVQTGNASRDADPYRGWFVGSFVSAELGLRSTGAVEVKWGTHALGDRREGWASSVDHTSLSLLVGGAIRVFFGNGEDVLLAEPGDYVVWPAGMTHHWQIEQADTVVVTIRWPAR